MKITAAHSVADAQLRDPQQIISLSAQTLPWDPHCIDSEATGPFWDLLLELDITLFVSREYEHLVVALSCSESGPSTSVLRVPHPSGLVADRERNVLHVACTRNPNQIMELAPVDGFLQRSDREKALSTRGLAPTHTRFFPGCLYLHDLAMVAGRLVGNAAGLNAIVDLDNSSVEWWPNSIETADGPELSVNRIQLNSIAAGATLEQSFFTASTERPTSQMPGDLDWIIDRQGVIFSGQTREPVVRGLTRPHSARLHADGSLWVNDSGYGTLNSVQGATAVPVTELMGWTRGLCLVGNVAVVGTSRVIPRFAKYAPGLDLARSTCGVHLVDLRTGGVLASLTWPSGNQIFAIDWLASSVTHGFLAGSPDEQLQSIENTWYRFAPRGSRLGPLST